MNKTHKIFTSSAAVLSAAILTFAATMSASAVELSTSTSATTNTNTARGAHAEAQANGKGGGTALTAAKTRADALIDARIKALNELSSRIGEIKRLSAANKTALQASLHTSITEMTTLKAKIDADTDAATLRTDIESITKTYRIFALIMPQGRIDAAADRIMGITATMDTLMAKLNTRITTAQANGTNVTAAQTALTDMHAKVADANTQAQAAVTLIANLKPDNGDKATMDANKTALQNARTKIKAAIADLKTARQDAGNIVKALATEKVETKDSLKTTKSTKTK